MTEVLSQAELERHLYDLVNQLESLTDDYQGLLDDATTQRHEADKAVARRMLEIKHACAQNGDRRSVDLIEKQAFLDCADQVFHAAAAADTVKASEKAMRNLDSACGSLRTLIASVREQTR